MSLSSIILVVLLNFVNLFRCRFPVLAPPFTLLYASFVRATKVSAITYKTKQKTREADDDHIGTRQEIFMHILVEPCTLNKTLPVVKLRVSGLRNCKTQDGIFQFLLLPTKGACAHTSVDLGHSRAEPAKNVRRTTAPRALAPYLTITHKYQHRFRRLRRRHRRRHEKRIHFPEFSATDGENTISHSTVGRPLNGVGSGEKQRHHVLRGLRHTP